MGVRNQVTDALSHCPDFFLVRCNLMAPEVTGVGEWIDDIKAGRVDNE